MNALLERAGDPNLGARAALLGRVLTVELALRTVDAGIDEGAPHATRGTRPQPAGATAEQQRAASGA